VKAIQFVQSIACYLLSRAVGTPYPPVFWSWLSCPEYREVPEPSLPSEDGVRVRVRYGGICGSEIGLISPGLLCCQEAPPDFLKPPAGFRSCGRFERR